MSRPPAAAPLSLDDITSSARRLGATLAVVWAWGLPTAAVAGATSAATRCDTVESTATCVVASAGRAHYVSEEPAPDGRIFNREVGTLLPVRLGVVHTVDAWSVVASLGEARGVIDYQGQTQFGVPLVTRTDLSRRSVGVAVSHRFRPFDAGPDISLGGGIESLRTVRDIRETPITTRLTETLHTRQWALTSSVSHSEMWGGLPLRVAASLQLDRPASHTLSVDTHGLVDPIELRPGKRWGARMAIDVGLAVGSQGELSLRAGFERYRPGASDARTVFSGGLPSGVASYPGSTQRIRELAAQFTWRL